MMTNTHLAMYVGDHYGEYRYQILGIGGRIVLGHEKPWATQHLYDLVEISLGMDGKPIQIQPLVFCPVCDTMQRQIGIRGSGFGKALQFHCNNCDYDLSSSAFVTTHAFDGNEIRFYSEHDNAMDAPKNSFMCVVNLWRMRKGEVSYDDFESFLSRMRECWSFMGRLRAMNDPIANLSDHEAIRVRRHPANIPLSDAAACIVQLLYEQGADVYLVGGAVRDFLIHSFRGTSDVPFVCKDEDLATDFSEGQILACLSSEQAIQLGVRVHEKTSVDTFGVVFAHLYGKTIEIAPFRRDVGGTDGRRPERIERGSIVEDANRRDLTYNALYYDPRTCTILDFHGGVEDIRDRRTRVVGDPRQRFDEDKLRILRLVRFHHRFSDEPLASQLDRATLDAIAEFRDLRSFPGMSDERIYTEYFQGFHQARNRIAYINSLIELDLLPAVLPGSVKSESNIAALSGFPSLTIAIAWLLRHHPTVQKYLRDLAYPNEISRRVEFLIDTLRFSDEDGPEMLARRDRGIVHATDRELTEEEIRNNDRIRGDMKRDLLQWVSLLQNADPPHPPCRIISIMHLAECDPIDVDARDLVGKYDGKEIGKIIKERKRLAYTKSLDAFRAASDVE